MSQRDLTARRPPHWEHFAHAADMGVRGIGPSRNEAFAQAALALSAVVTDVAGIAARECVEIHCEADDDELLFVDWLNAVIYEMVTQHLIFARYEIEGEGGRLDARAWGEKLDVRRHEPAVEIKGATYTALSVSRHADGEWVAQTVVDV